MADLVVKSIPVPYAGLYTDTDPFLTPPGKAPLHYNLLTNFDGVAPVRGAFYAHTNLPIGSAGSILVGAWAFDNKVLVSLAPADATRVVPFWEVPYRGASANTVLSQGTLTQKLVDLTNLTVTNVVAADQNGVIGGRAVRVGTNVYGWGHAATTSTASCAPNGSTQWNRRILRWDGSTTTPTSYANAPKGGQDVASHLNRLFALGGIDTPSGRATMEPSTLYFSDQIGEAISGATDPLPDTAAAWQDDATGLTNKIVIGSPDNDFGVGLAHVGQNLVVFKRYSTYVLYGYSSATFTVRQVSSRYGCLDRRSIVETDEGVYFMSADGYMLFDGQSFSNISNGILNDVRGTPALITLNTNIPTNNPVVTASRIGNEYLLVSSIAQPFSSGTPTTTGSGNAWMLHMPTRRWTRFSTSALESPSLVTHVGRTELFPYVFDTKQLVLAGRLGENQRGGGNPPIDVVTGASSTTTTGIFAGFTTSILRLSSPSEMAQLHRVLTEFQSYHNSQTLNAVNILAANANGSSLLPSTTISVGSNVNRTRDVQDCYAETAEFRLSVYNLTSQTSTDRTNLEFYDCAVEYQPTRQRRSS